MKNISKNDCSNKKHTRRVPEFVRCFRSQSIAMAGGFRTEITSDNDAVVWGVKSICDYTSQRIALKHKGGIAVFEGCGLSCQSYMEGVVCIRGCIFSLHFERV